MLLWNIEECPPDVHILQNPFVVDALLRTRHVGSQSMDQKRTEVGVMANAGPGNAPGEAPRQIAWGQCPGRSFVFKTAATITENLRFAEFEVELIPGILVIKTRSHPAPGSQRH